jgi:hypothetical protein
MRPTLRRACGAGRPRLAQAAETNRIYLNQHQITGFPQFSQEFVTDVKKEQFGR